MSTSTKRKSLNPLTLLGVDLGKKRDYSAIALLEREPVPTGKGTENHYKLTYIERLPLEAPYTVQVAHLKGLYTRLISQGREVDVVMDRGGVGEGVVDLVRAAGLKPVCVFMTGGQKVTRDGLDFNVPKKDIVSAVEVLLENGHLEIHAGLPYARLLVSELGGFNYETNARGNVSFGNDVGVLWREQEHDDLVFSVAFAAWYGENQPPPRRRAVTSYSYRTF